MEREIMIKPKQHPFQHSRRRFLMHTGGLSALAATGTTLPVSSALASLPSANSNVIRENPLGFNGIRKDPATKLYPLGNGYRMYSPTLMRFNAQDSLSPFGRGGVNGYTYCLDDPINRNDPSGHFALLSLLIGAIVGAVVGAAVSAAAEGIQMAINPEHKFDWKQVGIGAALGFISGGFGAAAQGAKTSVKFGLAVGDSVVSGSAGFGLNVATGIPIKQAGINAGIGVIIGLATFMVGVGRGTLHEFEQSLGGAQKNGKRLFDKDIFYFTDKESMQKRVNIVGHGSYIKSHFTPESLFNHLSENYSINKVRKVRLIGCGLADEINGTPSFAEQFSKFFGQGTSVKSYSGTVTIRYNSPANFNVDENQFLNTFNREGFRVNIIKKGRNYKPVYFEA